LTGALWHWGTSSEDNPDVKTDLKTAEENAIKNDPVAFGGVQNAGDGVSGLGLQKLIDSPVSSYVNTEDSLIWSIVNLCIPGIIKNLNEYRQIKCQYAICLRDMVPQGVPKSACDELKSYMTCKYIWGEFFAFFPWTAFLNNILMQLKAAFSTPTGALGFVTGILCEQYCTWDTTGLGYRACRFADGLRALGDIIQNVSRLMSKDSWQIKGEDLCEQL